MGGGGSPTNLLKITDESKDLGYPLKHIQNSQYMKRNSKDALKKKKIGRTKAERIIMRNTAPRG